MKQNQVTYEVWDIVENTAIHGSLEGQNHSGALRKRIDFVVQRRIDLLHSPTTECRLFFGKYPAGSRSGTTVPKA